MNLELKILNTDILIIGGGTAGCFAALTIANNSDCQVIITEKANIKRSGCLAAGVNALNAYILKGETPESYLEYVRNDAEGIIREDLVISMAKRLNEVTRKVETMGLVIQKDSKGDYVARGRRNIKINGENIKPLLAEAVEEKKNVQVLNQVNMIDYVIQDNRVIGAYGFSIKDNIFFTIQAKAVICATGGAAGLYRPNNPGFSRHKMWYSPFNTGAGYAMGIRAGAEMTSMEMRFIALRCKDTIAPTGTIAQGVGASQINGKGEEYERNYGAPSTPNRMYSTIRENMEGRGPCYLETKGMPMETQEELYKAYLNMAPAQTLRWIERGKGPSVENVEIEGTEPYIVGGHTASGYWVDTKRAATLVGLYAAGDVAGGSPQKYVTGCFAEGEIAALSAMSYIERIKPVSIDREQIINKFSNVTRFLKNSPGLLRVEDLEEAMQKVMDEYAGGISAGYMVNMDKLFIAREQIKILLDRSTFLRANDMHELVFIYEVIDRLYVCQVVIEHLIARKETRWHCYNENADYPKKDDEHFFRYVNSRYGNGNIEIIFREIVKKDEQYEHQD
ncbi:adenylyl-sulfate reductase subunit alpha [Desulfosporosinus sp.]|uniref:adenylyl-sulfate reductase subunit alpha n=1 Tax=Desulfosporosinus sp. TaxID=157907 RepID=UPI0025B8178C|nr:adenylyl-sulfate reductase subunit alpha [Desulfosporosinus sp.]MBC2723895.1 adenylyl-sulfate reductase subunit alpha [Desulfosporosinus sp.]MBC2725308.1 adenylyl-sulfate reductase subunit alpha [Desulfosporosinus sp.]